MRLLPCLLLRARHPKFWSLQTVSHRRIHDSISSQSGVSLLQKLDPFNYTDGKWLLRGEEQFRRRHLKFDLQRLCEGVLSLSPGAKTIESCEKHEGGSNRVFIFTLDNTQKVVARLPTSVAGPAKLTTNTEVATITYLQKKTSIPIPLILDWSDDVSNPVGAEYIIFEHAEGVQLHHVWHKMDETQQIRCIRNLTRIVAETTSLEFQAYGSIYYKATNPGRGTRVELRGEYELGPHCAPRFGDHSVGEPRWFDRVKANRGPWPNLQAYANGLIDTGISRIPLRDPENALSVCQGTVDEHIEAARGVLAAFCSMPTVQTAAKPTLWHPDLNKRNIFVSQNDPTQITAFIDWQGSGAEPALQYVDQIPDFTVPSQETIEQDDKASEPQANLQRTAYDESIRLYAPKIHAAKEVDTSIWWMFHCSDRSWNNGVAFFRQELIDTAIKWQRMGVPGECPYILPEGQDHEDQKDLFQLLKMVRSFHTDIMKVTGAAADGWVPIENWEDASRLHREYFEHLVSNMDDSVEARKQVTLYWPYDIPGQE